MDKRFDKIVQFVENNIKQIIIGLVSAAIFAPVIVWLCYSVFPTVIHTEITADGMLSYLGNVIGGAVSLLVAIVALYQAGAIHRMDQEQAEKKRKKEICPSLRIDVNATPACFMLKIFNDSSNPAIGVYLFEYSFSPVVTQGKPVKKWVFLREWEQTGGVFVDPSYLECNEDGYPKEIVLYFADVDRHIMCQPFRRVEDNQYEPCDIEYMN